MIDDLTEEILERFTDVMVTKIGLGIDWISDPKERERQLVQQVIVDTWLLTTGKVPIEKWEDG